MKSSFGILQSCEFDLQAYNRYCQRFKLNWYVACIDWIEKKFSSILASFVV